MSIKSSIWVYLLCIIVIMAGSGCRKGVVDEDYILENNFPIVTIGETSKIMASDFYNRLAASDILKYGGILDSTIYFDTLLELVVDTLVSIEAEEVDLRRDMPLYSNYISRYHGFYIRYLYQHMILDSLDIDSSTVDSFYRAHPEDFVYPEQVRARQLVISAEGLMYGEDSLKYREYSDEELDSIAREQVADIRLKIDSGADFGEMAREYSVNRETAMRGGELGYFFRGRFNKEFEEMAFTLEPGALSDPFKSPDGWHLLEVIDHVDSGLVDLTPEVYKEAVRQLAGELGDEKSAILVDSLMKAARIVYNDSALAGSAAEVPDTTWAASINDRDTIYFYRLSDFFNMFKMRNNLLGMTLNDKKGALQSEIVKYLVMQAGDDLGFGDDPEVKNERESLYHKYAVDFVEKESRVFGYEPPDSLVEQYYEENLDKYVFEKPVYVQHIIVEDSLFGEYLRDQALSGVDFLELAERHYPGAEEIRRAAADLGFIGAGEMPEVFYETALKMTEGDISPPVRTEWGFHIIKLMERRYNRSLEQVRTSIVEALKQEHARRHYRQWRRDLMAEYDIEFHLDGIKRIELAAKDRR